MKLIDNWKTELHRLWSIRIGLFFFVLNGAVLGIAALADVLNPWLFLVLNMAGYGLIGAMRLLKQAPAVPIEPSSKGEEA
ncbi:MAG: hypothetical protein JWP25_3612 [Bradyrhizobium sp.]|nr:hypothetical protein [Bradyrhizobium sp.]